MTPALGACRIGACEFTDDDHFCVLESLVVQLGAKEVVLPRDLAEQHPVDGRRIRELLSRCAALPSERPKALFATKSLDQDLRRLLRDSNLEQHRPVLDRPLASAATAAVISFLELPADQDNFGRYSLSLHDSGRYMRVDAEAQRALNVLRGKADTADTFSLYGLLNRCRTPMVRRSR